MEGSGCVRHTLCVLQWPRNARLDGLWGPATQRSCTFQVLSRRAFFLFPGIPKPHAPLGPSQGSFNLWTITLSPGEDPAQEVWPNRPQVV